MKRILAHCLLLFFFVFGITNAQRIIVEKPKDSTKSIGLFYSLPRTVLDIEFEVIKTTTEKPEDPNMCNKVMGNCKDELGQKPFSDGVSFKIKNVSFTSRAIPDAKEIYKVNPKSKWNKKKTISFTLSQSGTVKGSNVAVEDTTLDLILSVVSTAASFMKTSDFGKTGDFKGLDAITKKRYQDKRDRIKQLITSKEKLITSTNINGDKAILEFKLAQVDKLIASELKELIGSKKTEIFPLKFSIDLKKSDHQENVDLLKFYEQTEEGSGVEINKNALENFVLPYKLTRKNVLAGGKTKFLKMKIKELPSLSNSILLKKVGQGDEKGLPYRIPARVSLGLTFGQFNEPDPIFYGEFEIAQLGSVAYLPYKMDSAELSFYEESGGLQSLKVTSNPVYSPEDITNIDSVRQSLKGKTEIEKLQQKVDELTLRKQLEDLLNGTPIENDD